VALVPVILEETLYGPKACWQEIFFLQKLLSANPSVKAISGRLAQLIDATLLHFKLVARAGPTDLRFLLQHQGEVPVLSAVAANGAWKLDEVIRMRSEA